MPRSADERQKSVDRVLDLAARLQLAEVTLGTSYGDPSLKVRKATICTVKTADTLYLPCPLEMKEVLMESAPEIYYQTDHYKGWPGLLVRLDVIGDEELGLRIANAWASAAPRTLVKKRG